MGRDKTLEAARRRALHRRGLAGDGPPAARGAGAVAARRSPAARAAHRLGADRAHESVDLSLRDRGPAASPAALGRSAKTAGGRGRSPRPSASRPAAGTPSYDRGRSGRSPARARTPARPCESPVPRCVREPRRRAVGGRGERRRDCARRGCSRSAPAVRRSRCSRRGRARRSSSCTAPAACRPGRACCRCSPATTMSTRRFSRASDARPASSVSRTSSISSCTASTSSRPSMSSGPISSASRSAAGSRAEMAALRPHADRPARAGRPARPLARRVPGRRSVRAHGARDGPAASSTIRTGRRRSACWRSRSSSATRTTAARSRSRC